MYERHDLIAMALSPHHWQSNRHRLPAPALLPDCLADPRAGARSGLLTGYETFHHQQVHIHQSWHFHHIGSYGEQYKPLQCYQRVQVQPIQHSEACNFKNVSSSIKARRVWPYEVGLHPLWRLVELLEIVPIAWSRIVMIGVLWNLEHLPNPPTSTTTKSTPGACGMSLDPYKNRPPLAESADYCMVFTWKIVLLYTGS